jgi:C1A family cysteine protease
LASIGDSQWEDFKSKYNKTYSNVDEEFYRYTVFVKNMKRASELQKKEKPNGAVFGVTKFSDLTEDEFRAKYLMPKDFEATYNPTAPVATSFPPNKLGISANPTNFNWFNQGVCTPVYNQGECGSCWAFSATETIESWWALSGKPLTGLSMEQIVDCDTTCYGCGGGWPYLAYEYVEGAGGIESYQAYPYTAESGTAGSCQFNAGSVVAKVSNYQTVSGETGLYNALQTGPVSVCVDASSWSAYSSGVLTSCGNSVDHCVQLVGYANYNQAGAYWIVRNSWGTDWGQNGFIYVAIGQDLCDIGDYATVVSV